MIPHRTVSSPSRRVVVVRNPRNPPVDQGPIYMEDVRRSHVIERPAIVNEGNKQLYLMRRPAQTYEAPRIISPARSPPILIDTSRVYARSPSPIRTYQPPPPVVVQHTVMESPRRPQYVKTAQVRSDPYRETSENYGTRHCWQRLLNVLSRHMCLIVVILLIVLLIAMADIVVCAAFLAIDYSTNTSLKIAGIIIGVILALGVIGFLFFLLCCLGKRDGLFSYFGKHARIGGQGYALISPAHTYTQEYPSPARPPNVVYSQPALPAPVPMQAPMNYDPKPDKHNIVIEMPEHLVSGQKMSPGARERSLGKVVKNIGSIVEDAKRRNNGDMPKTVVVKVD